MNSMKHMSDHPKCLSGVKLKERLKRINYPINAHRCIILVTPRWADLARRGWGRVLEGGGKLLFVEYGPIVAFPAP